MKKSMNCVRDWSRLPCSAESPTVVSNRHAQILITSFKNPPLQINYDAAGNRISKVIKPRTASGVKANTYWATEYYVRDAQGNLLSTYKQRDSSEISKMYFTQTEQHIYGNNRLGIDETQTQLLGLTASADTSHHYSGYKLYEMSNHLGNVLTTISDRKIPVNPQGPAFIYSTPDVVRTSIDSLGGMKIQPMQQFAGNHFTIPATIGNNYKVDFYLNLANTNPDSVTGDWSVISYDANNANGYSYNWLDHTGHYSFTLNAPDTLFDFKILYYNQGSAPYHYMLFDSLQITEVGNIQDTIVAYTSDIRSVSDVSGFGAPLAGRTWNAGADPNSFNGKRKTDEVYGSANFIDFGMRGYDPRLARLNWSVDPMAAKHFDLSPYAFSANSPILLVDKDGRDFITYIKVKNAETGKTETHKVTFNGTEATIENVKTGATTKYTPGTSQFVDDMVTSYQYIVNNGADVDNAMQTIASSKDIHIEVVETEKTGKTKYKNGKITVNFKEGLEIWQDNGKGKEEHTGNQSGALGFWSEVYHGYVELVDKEAKDKFVDDGICSKRRGVRSYC